MGSVYTGCPENNQQECSKDDHIFWERDIRNPVEGADVKETNVRPRSGRVLTFSTCVEIHHFTVTPLENHCATGTFDQSLFADIVKMFIHE